MRTIPTQVSLRVCNKCPHHGKNKSYEWGGRQEEGDSIVHYCWAAHHSVGETIGTQNKKTGKVHIRKEFEIPTDCKYILEHLLAMDGKSRK